MLSEVWTSKCQQNQTSRNRYRTRIIRAQWHWTTKAAQWTGNEIWRGCRWWEIRRLYRTLLLLECNENLSKLMNNSLRHFEAAVDSSFKPCFAGLLISMSWLSPFRLATQPGMAPLSGWWEDLWEGDSIDPFQWLCNTPPVGDEEVVWKLKDDHFELGTFN